MNIITFALIVIFFKLEHENTLDFICGGFCRRGVAPHNLFQTRSNTRVIFSISYV